MNKKVIKRAAKYIFAYKLNLVSAALCAIMYVAFTLLGPVFIGKAIDFCIEAGNVDFIVIGFYLNLLIISTLLAAVFQWFMQVGTRKVSAKVAKAIRIEAFNAINCAPVSELDGRLRGDLVSRLVNDADNVGEGILHGLTQLLPGAATILGTLCVMLWQNVFIAVIVVAITPLSIFFAAFISKRTSKMFKEQAQAQGEVSSLITEVVEASSVVRAFGYEGVAQERFSTMCDDLYQSGQKAIFYSSLSNPGTRFVNSIVYACVLVFGAIYVVLGNMSIGQLSCFLTYANQYTKPFNEISGVLTQMETAVAGAKRLFEIIDIKRELIDANDAISPLDVRGEIEIRNVAFSYNNNQKLIADFNLHVMPGERIAIVGPTGCGKTTLINLLMRFYDVNSGQILLDGTDIKQYERESLRRAFGMVLQETWLKSATIRENIAYGEPEAKDDEIISAAKESYAHSFIRRLPKRYDTFIEAGGGNLSEGQKQLLCIARVMLKKPDILILDEATSSIDTRTEILVQKAFAKLMQGRTSFVVAHRLSTIETADQILVMNAGNIVESGTHKELLKANGFYANLYKSQFAAE